MMNVYVASSWRNPFQPGVVEFLRSEGFEVYDFRNPSPGDSGFHWSEIDGGWKDWDLDRYKSALESDLAKDGFGKDFAAMEWADACVLVLPCGRSAHLELGWFAGQGKPTVIVYPQANWPVAEVGGHSMNNEHPCAECGDLDGCHVPAQLLRIEPELMYKMCGAIENTFGGILRALGRP